MIFSIMFGMVILCLSVGYYLSAKRQSDSRRKILQKRNAEIEYVKTNMAIFGVNNNGTSLDKREVVRYSKEELGITEDTYE